MTQPLPSGPGSASAIGASLSAGDDIGKRQRRETLQGLFLNLATQHLRLLTGESDSLRREVNEWRVRAGVSILEEPPRSESFGAILRGEALRKCEVDDMFTEGGEGDNA
ncbi:hypothetical protein C8R44DRAFT_893817 [Mycena epipterygia]|nr:hypothetical protein C8R44DRAFT_893817 [Mycena epipterygia]